MLYSDSFHVMSKPTGSLCNLDCTYCFYLEKEKLYPGDNNFVMNDEVLESYISQYIESQNVPKISFSWQGGEPTLLGIEYFEKVIELQKKYAGNKSIVNAFQTNGVLLNDDWCNFFKRNSLLVGLSIDGPEDLHNKYRPYKGDQPSFDKVIKGVELLNKHKVQFNTLTCVSKSNEDKPQEVYEFLKSIGSRYMQFIPIVERKSNNDGEKLRLVKPNNNNAILTDWSVGAEEYGGFLKAIFDKWVRNDVGKYFVQIFDVALESWHGVSQSLCVFKDTCGTALALEHNGDLYSCDHYVYPDNKLGNILDESMKKLVNSDKQQNFGDDKLLSLPKYCLNCDVRFACNGECPKHRFISTPEGEPGLNYLCAGYKLFFKYIDPYMKFMSNELMQKRPPANVIKWSKDRDRGFPGYDVGRNDPCPCGSGNKFKNCCAK